ncbi:major royal jelly family protein [Bradyrhizobium lablabi]|uniref:major royal jelly family protein n=1 Tax=Bradyrhizobium lablabi TaxID=722472 RepID=UPI0020128753|nr:major royal jelly family protein [Bradyrhizobium lablabi]
MAAPVDRLVPEFASETLIINGVTTTSEGRRFVVVQPQGPDQPQIAEISGGSAKPFPDAEWNGRRRSQNGRNAFVGANSLRVGPDGALWVVDRGAAGIGAPLVEGGPKLVRIDLGANRVTRVYDLASVAQGASFVDDVRFNGGLAYLTDAGRPALIVLDLTTGKARRVLENHPSTVAARPLMGEGRQLVDAKGRPVVVHADQLEVSGDGRWLYYQPCSGPMSRIETRFLDDPSLDEATLSAHVEPFADTPSTGGTAIDAAGTIYISDTDRSRILRVSAAGEISTLIADPRLVWVDAMWIDDDGKLWMPAAQLNRTAGLNQGKDAVDWPVRLYSIAIGAKPVRR